ncbi:MAG: lipase maturation factor family protein, partial [Acidobacteriota bacterium]|nr:lipase maturation factor family protein [Acidobacteriota bacterium]
MPERPLVLFDGKCGFCRIWIDYFQALTGPRVDYAPTAEVAPKSVVIELPGGETFSGARAVMELLRYVPGFAWLHWLYWHVPLFAVLSEWAYTFVAEHRPFFDKITRIAFGRRVLPSSYIFIEWLFIRALAVIYLIAFVSFGTQVRGLVGSHGILPVHSYLQAVAQNFGASRYWLVPTVFWVRDDDSVLVWICIAGAALAIILMLGFAQRLILIFLYGLYLSLCSAGQDFMSFQWDMLLLETGFLAIFLGRSKLIVWLMRWLLFRLLFLSGSVKLLSHDITWRSLNALRFHYWTQPLPTPLAWYMNQLPGWFQQASTAMVFLCELLVPLLLLGPRRVRHFAGYFVIGLQVLILLTGNYTFFNILTIALCLF